MKKIRREDQYDDMEGTVYERIERAGIELFGQKGFEAVLVRELAQTAGVTIGSISYYFGSKESLYRHCFEMLAREVVADLSRLDARPSWFPGDVTDIRTGRLRQLIRMWVDLGLTTSDGLREFGDDNILDPLWKALRNAYGRVNEERTDQTALLLGYLGSMVLSVILEDRQLEEMVGVQASEARGRWAAWMESFLAGGGENRDPMPAMLRRVEDRGPGMH
jgi:AcrR family transcriptional regulator